MSLSTGLDFCALPAQIPPEGQVSDFDDRSNMPSIIIAVCVVMMSSAVFLTAGRLFANRSQLAWSDYLSLVALICALAEGSLMLSQLHVARHQWNVRGCWILGGYVKIIIVRSMFMTTSLHSAKASIFVLLSQIFTIRHHMKLAIWAGLVATVLLYLMNIIIILCYFTPSPGQTWDDVVLSGKVDGSLAWTVASSVLNLVLNLYIFFLPLPIIARLSWPLEKRLKVVALFSTAFLAVVANAVSLVYRIFNMSNSSDRTWKVAAMMLCILVEMHVTIIVGSVPGFSKFWRVYVARWAPIKTLRSQLYGSGRATLSRPASQINNTRNKPRTGREDGPAQHRYLELNDSWLMKSNATVEITANGTLGIQPSTMVGIIRTADVEQASSELPPENVAAGHGIAGGVIHDQQKLVCR
ncbi:Rhodopsin domain-containing protein [Madurella fahalii]|uniref:Rhodopsin domain-containing protein n=1 Tax=Madurella fahalii TaxID=1157608 RepID=A0ABQ0FYH9_9PEZI